MNNFTAMVRAHRSLGFELEIWPQISSLAPFYIPTRELVIPLLMDGLGQGSVYS